MRNDNHNSTFQMFAGLTCPSKNEHLLGKLIDFAETDDVSFVLEARDISEVIESLKIDLSNDLELFTLQEYLNELMKSAEHLRVHKSISSNMLRKV